MKRNPSTQPDAHRTSLRTSGWSETMGDIVAWACIVIVVGVVIVGCLWALPGCCKPIVIEHVIRVEMPDEVRALLELISDPNRAVDVTTSQPAPLGRTLEYTDRMMDYD